MNQQPDGIVVDVNLRRIYVIEVPRTEARLRVEEYEIYPIHATTARTFP